MFYAVSSGKIGAVKYLIETLGADPTMIVWHLDYTPFKGTSLLNLAIFKNQLETLQYLITAPQFTQSTHFKKNIATLERYANKNNRKEIAAYLGKLFSEVQFGKFVPPERPVVTSPYSA